MCVHFSLNLTQLLEWLGCVPFIQSMVTTDVRDCTGIVLSFLKYKALSGAIAIIVR